MPESAQAEKAPEVEIEPEAIETNEQPESEEFDKERAMATIKKLRQFEKEAAKLKKLVDKYEQADKDRQDAELTELERLQKQLADVKAESARLKLETLKTGIAAEFGLPDALAMRLRGDDEESLRADAEALKEALPAGEKLKPKVSPTRIDGQSEQGETDAQRRARLLGRNSYGVFDHMSASERGGGVVAPQNSEG